MGKGERDTLKEAGEGARQMGQRCLKVSWQMHQCKKGISALPTHLDAQRRWRPKGQEVSFSIRVFHRMYLGHLSSVPIWHGMTPKGREWSSK